MVPSSFEQGPVAIYRMLQGTAFDEHAVKVMTAAYEGILSELGLTDRTDPLTEIVATKIITRCQMGERDAERICELALKDIRG
jgi:hypothetical protein